MVIKRLSRFFTQRGRRDARVTPSLAVSDAAATAAAPRLRPTARSLMIWESKLRAIAAETSAWTIETGGGLFGRW